MCLLTIRVGRIHRVFNNERISFGLKGMGPVQYRAQ
ncbi:MAG TPA: hypothetical protein DHU79_01670 [Clostridiales bacterium]|nr:hypothetical protein [Clostridiales bacterium]